MIKCWLSALAALCVCLTPVAGANSKDDDSIDVVLKVPMLVCHELSGGVRPPMKEKDEAEHDLIFFVLSGRGADGTVINDVAPKTGGYLKIDNRRPSMILKNINLWKGKLREGETVTLVISVREQDGKDTAEEDLKEAAQIAKQVDNTKSLAELARIPVAEVLRSGVGENDHIGTIVVRIKNEKGDAVLQTELGGDARYLKGYPSNHPTERSLKLNGEHSNYDLHLRVEED
jgi:hypothetical protein